MSVVDQCSERSASSLTIFFANDFSKKSILLYFPKCPTCVRIAYGNNTIEPKYLKKINHLSKILLFKYSRREKVCFARAIGDSPGVNSITDMSHLRHICIEYVTSRVLNSPYLYFFFIM